MSGGWVCYTGGNYWTVQFDDEKTGGDESWLTLYGAVAIRTTPTPPTKTATCIPSIIWAAIRAVICIYHMPSGGGGFDWFPPDTDPLIATTSVFYIAWEQNGDNPSTDSMGVDSVAGTHNRTGYQRAALDPDHAMNTLFNPCANAAYAANTYNQQLTYNARLCPAFKLAATSCSAATGMMRFLTPLRRPPGAPSRPCTSCRNTHRKGPSGPFLFRDCLPASDRHRSFFCT